MAFPSFPRQARQARRQAIAGGRAPDNRWHPLARAGFALFFVLLVLTGGIAMRHLEALARTSGALEGSERAVRTIIATLSLFKDGETGQRGYLLTGDPDFLEPWEQARRLIPRALDDLSGGLGADPVQRERLRRFHDLARAKLALLQETIDLARGGQGEEAVRVVRSGEGRRQMDEMRRLADAMQAAAEQDRLLQAARLQDLQDAMWRMLAMTLLTATTLVVLLWTARAVERRRRLQLESEIARREAAEADRAEALLTERAARRAAEDANRTKDDFVAVLSHELRAPLNAIQGWTQVLTRLGLEHPVVVQGLGIIDRNARQQGRLISDLFDLNRLRNGKLQLHRRLLEPADVARTVAGALEGEASRRGITLELDLDARPMPVLGDAERLEQVLWNLLSNALKFTPEGGHVGIESRQEDGWAVLRVRDDGAGIDPDFLPRLFDRYAQADSTSTRPHGGLGLGLSIVRQLVEMHGGTVDATSPGKAKGAVFTVRLPLAHGQPATPAPVAPLAVPAEAAAGPGTDGPRDAAPARDTGGVNAIFVDTDDVAGRKEETGMEATSSNRPSADAQAAPPTDAPRPPDAPARRANDRAVPAAEPPALAGPRLDGLRVLAVDDDEQARELMPILLGAFGAEVETAGSAQEALARLARGAPDVLVSDIGMPGMDGYELIRRLREREREAGAGAPLPAIALTAFTRAEDRVKALECGFHAHLGKPMDVRELAATIQRLCALRCPI